MTAQDLRIAREESANVAYQTFINHLSKNKDGFFCFFEGKDSPYYNLRIKQYVNNKKSYPISCKGKKMVLKVFELINYHKEYERYTKGFFVDKDYDESISGKHNNLIYETPTYSIENFYIQPQCVDEILKNEFGLTETMQDFISAIKTYNTLLHEITEAQTLFNAWYYSLKKKKVNENLESTGVSLEDKFPKRYLSIDLTGVKKNYDFDKIKNDFPHAIPIDEQTVIEQVKAFNALDKKNIFRGKYLLEFLFKFIYLLIEDSSTDQNVLKTKIHYRVELNQIISMYSQYSFTSDCLIKYLTQFN